MKENTNNNFWLFTTNYLKPFKGFFETREEAIEKLYILIKESRSYFRARLKKDVVEENYINDLHKDVKTYKIRTKASLLLKNWIDFSREDLLCSICIMDLSTCDKDIKERMFLKAV